MTDPRWAGYFLELMRRVLGPAVDLDEDLAQPWNLAGSVYGDPRLSRQRLGQRAFQAVVLDAYHRR